MAKVVLFDFDGTLADTAPDLVLTTNELLASYDLPPISFEAGRKVASEGTRAFLNLGFKNKSINLDDLTKQFLRIYQKNILNQPMLFEGVIELIDYLDKNNVRWGIVTNKPRIFTECILNYYNLKKRYTLLLCGDDGFRPKPAPDLLLEACRLLKITPLEVMYVGDGQRDIESAKSAKILSVLACYGYLKISDRIDEWNADYLINSPLELIDLID
ncbi:MAG: HAD-IA family hydrolase [Methylophilaceae bacterium]